MVREANGAQLYIARVKYYYGVHTAKCGEHLVGAYMPALSSGTEYIMNVCAKSDDVFSVVFYRCHTLATAHRTTKYYTSITEPGRSIRFGRFLSCNTPLLVAWFCTVLMRMLDGSGPGRLEVSIGCAVQYNVSPQVY